MAAFSLPGQLLMDPQSGQGFSQAISSLPSAEKRWKDLETSTERSGLQVTRALTFL